MERLYDKLKAYSESDFYAFHMPGHKRNKTLLGIELPYDLDITEIDGFDDLHHADGILKEEQERAARVFGAEESHFLVNGSTAGILSAVMGCTHRGDKILVARHCHKSIYHAIYMNGLVPRYVYPEFDISMHMNGEISKEDVAKALAAEPDIKAVVIVSPNYDGVVSDVKGIAEVAHSYRIPLIVDEAHGPHFGFHPAFPGRANDLGADVVINSLHKTLPSLTQTAILHINGKLANRRRIKKYLDMLQSSSPSYIFMASLDACVDFLDGKCEEAFELYVERLQKFREELKPLQHLQILRTEHYDISKVVISTANANITSPELADRLRKEYHLEMEMCGADYVTAIAAIGDSKKGLKHLKKALLEIDKNLEFVPEKGTYAVPYVANAAGILYNKEMFEEHGWKIPTTWDELMSLCQEIQNAGIQPFYFGFKDTWTCLAPWNAVAVDLAPADVCAQVNRGKTTFSKEYKEVAERMLELLPYGPDDPFAYDYNGACTAFAKGESAMYTIGSYAIPQIQTVNPDMEIDSFVMPANNNKEENKLNSGIDLQFCVMQDCKNKEAAYEVLDFLLEDENVQAYLDAQKAVPCKEGDFELPSTLEGMKEYIKEGKMSDYQDHYYPSEMAVDAQIQTFLMKKDSKAFLKKFDTDWVRYNRDIIRKVEDYEKSHND